MNHDSNNDLLHARYHSLPPLSPPHKPTHMDHSCDAIPYYCKPTPTIPQMEDRHERRVFTDKAERVVNQVLAAALTVLAVVFVCGLMYKAFVWGH
jgi:hypothetical protein